MKILLPALLFFVLFGCVKGARDTTYTYTCSTICKTDSFTLVDIKDTTLYNITAGESYLYMRNNTYGRCSTTCER